MAQKVVVIGSNSFSGATFVDCLLERGEEVIGMSRSPEPNRVFLPYKWSTYSSFEFHQLDLNHDLERIMGVVNDFRPDYVVNFAAQSMVAQSWDHPDHWFMTNVVSTIKFHDELRRCNFLRKYIHISTPEVYGSCAGCIKEDAPYNPSTPYAVSRAAADMSLHTFFKTYKFPVVFTRATNVFGPGQQLFRIIPRTILFIKLGRKLELHGGGRSIRSFIHVSDVCDGTLRVAHQGVPGQIYHLATKYVVSIREVVEMICQQVGVPFEDLVVVTDESLGKDTAYLLDSTKARQELGWRDTVKLEDGIKETIAWVDDNFDEIKNQPFDYIHKS